MTAYPEGSGDVAPRPVAVDIQRLLVAYVHSWLTGTLAPDGTDYGTVPVAIAVPNPHPPRYVRVWRAGGRTSLPLIYHQVFGPDTATRLDLSGRVHVALLSSAVRVAEVLRAVDESYPTEVVDASNPPVMFGSVSLLLRPY